MRILSKARADLRGEAAGLGVRPSSAEAGFLLAFVGAVAVVVARADRELFRFLTAEDHLLEWLQFVGFAAACVLSILVGARLLRAGRTWAATAFFLFAFGCFFIAGEEIAWGQRIFGFGTPEELEEINEQKETTLHNVGSVQDAANLVFACVGLYGAAVPWLLRWRTPAWVERRGLSLFVPPLFLSSFFLVVFGYKGLRYAFFPNSGYTVTKIGEWPEFCLAFAFAAFSFLVWRAVTAGGVEEAGVPVVAPPRRT